MKHIKLSIAVLSILIMTLAASCGPQQVKDGADSMTEESINDGTNPNDVSRVVNLSDDNLYTSDTKVTKPTILDFNAVWCGPCKNFAPAFDAASSKFGDDVDFISVDIDKNPKTAQAFNIESVPTLVILLPDGTTQRYVGTGELLPQEKFFAIVEKLL